jgi:hypothetical protein
MTGSRFIITFVSQRDVGAIRAVRRLLKYAGRHLGLRAVDVREEHNDVAREERSKQRRHTAPTEHFGAVLELITRANRR